MLPGLSSGGIMAKPDALPATDRISAFVKYKGSDFFVQLQTFE